MYEGQIKQTNHSEKATRPAKKAAFPPATESSYAAPHHSLSTIQCAPNKTGIPDQLKSGTEQLSGHSLDDVKVHYNSSKPARLQAHAYTQGSNIHMAPGQEKHLPHEVWHVVQQKQGRVKPTLHMQGGININDDVRLEREADEMGAKATQLRSRLSHRSGLAVIGSGTDAVQGKFYLKGPGGALTWHPEDPDTRLYESTDETTTSWFMKYPVYKNKLLDSRRYPKTSEKDTMKTAHETGTVPEKLKDQVQTMGAVVNSLSAEQKQKFNQAYDKFSPYCRPEDRANVVQGAITNVRTGPLFAAGDNNPETARAKTVFINRLELMAKFIAQVGEKPIGAGPAKIKSKYWIQSTGSDPHADGHHALFLIEKGNTQNKMLYKPHSLKFENAFIGTGGIISEANKSFNDKSKLPTMNIDAKAHTEEFIKRVGHSKDDEYSEADFKGHMKKLGMLEVASHVFGVTDLHAENIIFGKSGPVPIDSEVGGAYPDKTGIDDPMGPARIDEKQFSTPSSLHIKGQQNIVSAENLPEQFSTGKAEMADIIIHRKKGLLKQWRNRLRQVDSFRVVPISTSTLSHLVNAALNDGSKAAVQQEFTQQLTDFINNNELAKHLNLRIVKKASFRFWNILKNGTLPSFEMDMKTGTLLMDGVPAAIPQQQVDDMAETIVSKMSDLAKGRIEALNH